MEGERGFNVLWSATFVQFCYSFFFFYSETKNIENHNKALRFIQMLLPDNTDQ